MRETEASFRMLQNASLTRALRLAAIALGVGLVMAAGAASAPATTTRTTRPSRKRSSKASWPASAAPTWKTSGIDYRERSPLVVPPKLDLPPPAGTSAEVKAPNWPKDPDEQRRKAAIAARKKDNKDPVDAGPHPDAERTRGRQDRSADAAPAAIRCSPAPTTTIRS